MRLKTVITLVLMTILSFGFVPIENELVDITGLELRGNVKVFRITEITSWDSLVIRPYRESFTDEYHFDKNGNQIQTSSWIGEKYQGKVIYNYNEKGNLLTVNRYNSSDSLVYTELRRKYDANEKLMEEYIYEEDGSLVEKYSFKYGNDNKLVEKVLFSNSITWHGRYGECCSGPLMKTLIVLVLNININMRTVILLKLLLLMHIID